MSAKQDKTSVSTSVRENPKSRKKGLNKKKQGSVRNINGTIYVDFRYLGRRVRESAGLPWSSQNVRKVREQLDKIMAAIKLGTFRFCDVFPDSPKKDEFAKMERKIQVGSCSPSQVKCGEYMDSWYEVLRDSGRVSERTLWGYKLAMESYLKPFFGERTFAELGHRAFDEFFAWARKQRFRKAIVSNTTLNKQITVLKTICRKAALDHGWGREFNPFDGHKKLPGHDPYDKILPFSVEEQTRLLEVLPEHWRPYFQFAFCSGLRQGEQIALKAEDIDWEKGVVHIRRAMTLNEAGKPMEGPTKNKYSRRSIKLLPPMLESLRSQKEIHARLGKPEYFFCTPEGKPIHPSNLRRRVWIPALKKAALKIRDMKQTRHSFATNALSCGENPLWIARILGHRNTEMIIKVYSKYVADSLGINDGSIFSTLYSRETEGTSGNNNLGKIWAKSRMNLEER